MSKSHGIASMAQNVMIVSTELRVVKTRTTCT
jgi:hypothetical protein